MATVIPEVVFTNPDGTKGINYEKLVPVLVNTIKELNIKNVDLEARIARLEHKI